MNNSPSSQSIFYKLSQEAGLDDFIPLISESKNPEILDESSESSYDGKSIFQSLSEEQPNQSFSFIDTVKDVAKQLATKGTAGLLGAYGDITNPLDIRENQLPGEKARLQAFFNDPSDDVSDHDIEPVHSRLPTTKEVKDVIKYFTGIGEGETPAGRIAGRGAEFVGGGLAYPGAGGKKALSTLAATGVTGQSLREFNAPDSLASAVEIVGNLLSGAVSGKVMPTKEAGKNIAKAGRNVGLTEKQIAPLMQSEKKIATLSKVARKSEGTKSKFESIKESLGDSYQNIKQIVSKAPNLTKKQNDSLIGRFSNIRDELAKTVKASPDKESAIKFIDDAIIKLQNSGASPEELVNFWQDINKSVKWNSIQGGKKSLSALKDPILDVLKETSPKAAELFEQTNLLYSKYSTIAKQLKPGVVDAFLNKAEFLAIIPSGLALITGNPMPFTALGSELAVRTLASEMLTNPYFQNIANKLVKNFNQASVKGVTDTMTNVKEYMQRKHPEENWDFLTED